MSPRGCPLYTDTIQWEEVGAHKEIDLQVLFSYSHSKRKYGHKNPFFNNRFSNIWCNEILIMKILKFLF